MQNNHVISFKSFLVIRITNETNCHTRQNQEIMDFPHESHEQKGKKQHTDLIGNEDKETWFRSPLDTKITTKK